MDTSEGFVTLNELTPQLNLDKSNARKWLLKQGFSFLKVRDPISHQMVLALTTEDAESAKEMRRQMGYTGERQIIVDNGWEYFYVVQIVPDALPSRLKLGYATDCQNRLKAYTTVSPTAKILKCWPSAVAWEFAAIASLTRIECVRVGGEVFDCESVENLIRRGDEFFALMPQNRH